VVAAPAAGAEDIRQCKTRPKNTEMTATSAPARPHVYGLLVRRGAYWNRFDATRLSILRQSAVSVVCTVKVSRALDCHDSPRTSTLTRAPALTGMDRVAE